MGKHYTHISLDLFVPAEDDEDWEAYRERVVDTYNTVMKAVPTGTAYNGSINHLAINRPLLSEREKKD